MGAGVTGIRGKVRKGCEQLAELIKDKKRKNTNKKSILKTITLDVFGFNRGAAAARNFIYEINSRNKRPIDLAVKKSKKIRNYITVSYGMGIEAKVQEDVLLDRDKEEVDALFLEDGKMPQFGYLGYLLLKNGTLSKENLKEIQINIRFIGVYDTVSSYEEVNDSTLKLYLTAGEHLIKNQFQNDVEQLQLNNLGCFNKAVHFTAMDEHRENFDLTRMYITNAVSMPNSFEFNLPGVHCDVGGAYETGTENVAQLENSRYASYNQLTERIEKLISEYWYKKDQLKVNDKWFQLFTAGIIPRKISGSRYIHKEYSYIPLHFMETFFREILSQQVNDVFARMLVDKYPILPIKRYVSKIEDFTYKSFNETQNFTYKPFNETQNSKYIEDKTLIYAKDRLEKYVFGGDEEWRFISDEELIKQKDVDAKLMEQYNEENGIVQEVKIGKYELDFDPYNWNQIISNKNNEEIADGEVLDELIIPPYNEQKLLRILRNQFLHWSATRAGFGMDPRNNYKRVEH